MANGNIGWQPKLKPRLNSGAPRIVQNPLQRHERPGGKGNLDISLVLFRWPLFNNSSILDRAIRLNPGMSQTAETDAVQRVAPACFGRDRRDVI